MKRILLAGIALVALIQPVHAQGILVYDNANLLEQVQQLLQAAKSYGLQAQQYATQAQQYLTEAEQLRSFVHDPSLGAAAGLMNTAGLSNSLPVNPLALASMASGIGGITSLSGVLGKLSQLNGLVNSNYSSAHVYSPTDQSWNSQQLIANGTAIAAMQGAAQSAYQDLRNHLPIIQALQDRLATATTPKDVMDAHAALQAQATWANNLNSEVQAMDINYRAQADSRVQRDNESLDAGIDSFIAQANAAGRGVNPK